MFFSILCLICFRAHLFICALWSPAWKGLASWLSFVVYNCEFIPFPFSGILGQVWYLIVSIPDLCTLTYFDKKEAVNQKAKLITKWNLKFSCSETASSIQDVFSEVGKRSYYGEQDRPAFSALNQL